MRALGAERGDNDVTAVVPDPLSTAQDGPIGKSGHQILDLAFAGEWSDRRTTVSSGTSSSRSGATHRHLVEAEPNSKQLCYFDSNIEFFDSQSDIFVATFKTGVADFQII
jgi:hypothetical protein